MALSSGARLGPYELVGLLGRGGMGEVYRARDARLGREVAIKVLPAAFSQDAERLQRFELEARAAAALNHPNIVTVHDVGVHEGAPYVVMELLEGQTLRQRLRADPLPVSSALDFAQQAARGLAAAHDKRIVHRDLKPENLFLTTDGRLKILDFGLAKLRPAPSDAAVTSAGATASVATMPGALVGTVGYMAPEQVRGEAAEPRSDLFAFGAVLYEMLSGRRAFGGDSAIDTLHAIVKEDPPPLASVAPTLPAGVEGLVRRCLEKRAQDRFRSAHDLALALEAISGVAGPVPAAVPRPTGLLFRRALAFTAGAAVVVLVVGLIWKGIPGLRETSPTVKAPATLTEQQPSIVVLPFDDISPGGDSEYYADGVTVAINGKLTNVRAFKKVIAHATASSFKGTRKPPHEIAGELKVRYVLAGSVQRAGNSLRISAELIDGASGASLWTNQFPGTLDDVFDMQEKVARAIADGLNLKLTAAEDRQIARRPITNALAYDYYLRARNALIRFAPGDIDAALELLQKGLEVTGENALLYAGLAYVHFQYGNTGLRQDEAFREAERYAAQALRLDPETAQAYMVLGLVQGTFHRDPQQAVRYLKQALSIDPSDCHTLFWLILVYATCGQTSAASALADRLTDIDPLDALTPSGRFWVHFSDGRFEAGAKDLRQVVALLDEPATRVPLAYTLAAARQVEDALAVLSPIGPSPWPDVNVQLAQFLKLALQGKPDKVRELLTPEFVATARRDPLNPLILADCYAMLDEREQAFQWLEHAVSRGFINYPYLSEYDPFLAKLRTEPRFQKLMTRVKEQWERFEE